MMPHGDGFEDTHMAYDGSTADYSPGGKLAAAGTVLEACYALGGETMATASSSGAIQVWGASESGWNLLHTEQLPSSDNQPTQLAWAHPQHGQVLAVGTRNGSVHVIQGPVPSSDISSAQAGKQAQAQAVDQQAQRPSAGWCSTAQLQCGKGPVSALVFAPHQHGLVLAAACSRQQFSAGASNGYVQLWEAAGKASSCAQWTLVSKVELSEAAGTCSCLCWHQSTPGLPPLLLGGHADGCSIWGYNSPNMMWQELASFAAPAGAGASALSVHWAPALGRPFELIAASFGSTVVLYKVQQARSSNLAAAYDQQRQLGQLEVVQLQELAHPAPVWKLEFSMIGSTLACSLDGTAEVWLWMPLMNGTWKAVSKLVGQEQQQASKGAIDDGVMVD